MEVTADVSHLSVDELESLCQQGLVAPVDAVRELRNRATLQHGTDARLAREAAEKALLIGKGSGDRVALGWGYRSLAEAAFFSGAYKDAEEHFRSALREWKDTPEEPRSGELQTALVHVLTLLGRYDEALAAASQARTTLEISGNEEYQAKLAMNLGTLHFQRDDHNAALEECRKATEIFRAQNRKDPSSVGAEINLAVALTQTEQPKEALDAFARAEAMCRENGFTLLLAQCRMNAALVRQQTGDFGEALRLLGLAQEYFQETEHVAYRAANILSRAEVYHELGLHRETTHLAGDAAQDYANEGMVYYEGLARYHLALANLALGRSAPARQEIERAQSAFLSEENESRSLLCRLVSAQVDWAEGRADVARESAEVLVREFRKRGLLRWEALTTALLARAALSVGASQGTVRRLRGVLSRVDATVYPGMALLLLDTLAEVYLALGQTRSLTRTSEKTVELLESIRFRIPGEEAKLAFLQDKGHVFDRRVEIEAARSRPRLEVLFSLMERGRAQRAWDSFHTLTEPKYEREGHLRELRDQLSWAHARASRLELGTESERKMAVRIREDLEGLESDYRRELQTSRERSWLASGSGPEGSLELEAVTEALPKEAGLVSYHLGAHHSFALVLTGNGDTFRVELPSASAPEIRRLADELDFQWRAAALENASRLHLPRKSGGASASQSPTDSEGQMGYEGDPFSSAHPMVRSTLASLRDLYDRLWRPLGAPPEVETWMIAPHGPGHRIPFHALFDGHRFLVDHGTVSTVPSARVWLESHRKGDVPSRRAWIAGLSQPDIPHVERELETVASLFAAGSASWDPVIDPAPTRSKILEEGGRSGLLHLATHGQLRVRNPAFSSLQLADGPLFVHDLEDADFSGATVVLTACSSGKGRVVVADEWTGLGQGFLHAGARNIVASLWEVEDGASSVFAEGFYAAICGGKGPVEGHRSGTLRVRDRFSHPWHWAPFSVMGGVSPRSKTGAVIQ